MTDDAISSRHFLAADGLKSANKVSPLTVRITLSDAWAAAPAGQLLATSLVNLLARQAGIVEAIELAVPDTRVKVWLPYTSSDCTLPEALERLVAWAAGDRVRVALSGQSSKADLVIAIGAAPGATDAHEGKTIHVYGCGWCAWIGALPLADQISHPESENPLGPFLGAALAAGEVFKRCRGLVGGRFLDGDGYSLWTGETARSWRELAHGPELRGGALPPIHLIGAGAVGNDIAYTIANAGFADAYVIVIDDDSYDRTNLNRCLLAGMVDIGSDEVPANRKALAIAAQLARAGVPSYAYDGTIREYVLAPKAGLRADLASTLEFPIVLSCVDRAVSRHDIQGLWPRLLLDGSTLGLRAKTNAYRQREGAPCLGCHEPVEDDAAKVRAFEAQLRNMPENEQRAYLEEKGLNGAAISAYLDDPTCGGEGEAELRNFATRTEAQFSVGFVSLGASLLLAASLFRRVLYAETSPARMDMAVLNFLSGAMGDVAMSRDDNCQLNCAIKPIATAT